MENGGRGILGIPKMPRTMSDKLHQFVVVRAKELLGSLKGDSLSSHKLMVFISLAITLSKCSHVHPEKEGGIVGDRRIGAANS